MTNKMRTRLLLDAIEQHNRVAVHDGRCCVQARLAAQEMADQAQTLPVAAAPAEAPAELVAPRKVWDRLASEKQIGYLARLLRERDVAAHWMTEGQRLLAQGFGTALSKEVSRVLDQVTTMPVKTDAPVREMTPRQRFTVTGLLADRVHTFGDIEVDALNFATASEMIDILLAAPKHPKAPKATASRALPEEGIYLFEGSYYKIQIDVHNTGRKMCKKLHPSEVEGEKGVFRKVSGMGGKLTAEHKLSLEQAKEFGKLYGQCVCCGAVLTKDESIEKGIGPVCEGKYF
jgi:hypothetical protein